MLNNQVAGKIRPVSDLKQSNPESGKEVIYALGKRTLGVGLSPALRALRERLWRLKKAQAFPGPFIPGAVKNIWTTLKNHLS